MFSNLSRLPEDIEDLYMEDVLCIVNSIEKMYKTTGKEAHIRKPFVFERKLLKDIEKTYFKKTKQ